MKNMKYALVLMLFVTTLSHAQTDNGMFVMDEFRNPRKREVIQVPGKGSGGLDGRPGCNRHY
jgi:hypothetical protein